MVFSSPTFLFLFLPVVLILYTVLPKKNLVLLCASLTFYAWGEPVFIVLMLAVIFGNYLFGLALASSVKTKKTVFLALAVAFNLGVLFHFKYTGFFLSVLSDGLELLGLPRMRAVGPQLPLGISFFIFQSMTYVIDIYWNRARAERSVLDVALYISLFPQLVAGPIIRFREIGAQIHHRVVSWRDFSIGCERFIIGLAKKVLLADTLAVPVDAIFAIPPAELPAATAWFGAVCFGLQIYYDFSGYSDMAIGLGRMFGFRFPENFRHPYESLSLREFWRRWHMTLSRWFRDYLYIPLGGNRVSTARTYVNLVIVFFLTGLWHGASWNFIVWGLFHGLFLTLERIGLEQWLGRGPRMIQHLYLLLVVYIGWVLFRAENLTHAMGFLKAMFVPVTMTSPAYVIEHFAAGYIVAAFVLGIGLSSDFIWKMVNGRVLSSYRRQTGNGSIAASTVALIGTLKFTTNLLLILLSLMTVASQSHKAFIYFRF